jgi:hypothetical protein
MFELRNLRFGKIFIEEDLVVEREQLLLAFEGLKSISHSLESKEKGGVKSKTSSVEGHIKDLEGILKEHCPNLLGVWEWVR